MSGEELKGQPGETLSQAERSAVRTLGQRIQASLQSAPQQLEAQRLGTLSPSASPEAARPSEAESQALLKTLSQPSPAPRIQAESSQPTLTQRGPRP